MRMGHYILDEHKQPVPVDLMAWANWFQYADRRIAQTLVGDIRVSTVFLGIDHNWGDGPPLLFETMVFGGELDQECDRYSSFEEAEWGHEQMVKRVKEHINS